MDPGDIEVGIPLAAQHFQVVDGLLALDVFEHQHWLEHNIGVLQDFASHQQF